MVSVPKTARIAAPAMSTHMISPPFQAPAIIDRTAETTWVTGLTSTKACNQPGIVAVAGVDVRHAPAVEQDFDRRSESGNAAFTVEGRDRAASNDPCGQTDQEGGSDRQNGESYCQTTDE